MHDGLIEATFRDQLAALSMDLFQQNFSCGDAACNSRQHCSSAATHGPASLPSTLRKIFPRFFSVVILSIDSVLLVTCRCIVITIRCKDLVTFTQLKTKDLRSI